MIGRMLALYNDFVAENQFSGFDGADFREYKDVSLELVRIKATSLQRVHQMRVDADLRGVRFFRREYPVWRE